MTCADITIPAVIVPIPMKAFPNIHKPISGPWRALPLRSLYGFYWVFKPCTPNKLRVISTKKSKEYSIDADSILFRQIADDSLG